MKATRLKVPTIILAVVALLVGVSGGAVAAKLITGEDIKDNTVKSADIKNGTLVTKDLKKGGVSADRLKSKSIGAGKLKDQLGPLRQDQGRLDRVEGPERRGQGLVEGRAGPGWAARAAGPQGAQGPAGPPGVTAFPQTLWGPMIRNQQGAAQSTLQTGPAPVPMGTGSLKLLTTGTSDLAAFGDSVDFAGIPLGSITSLSYSSYNPDVTPADRPSLRLEVNPHLVGDGAVGGVFEFTTVIYEPADGVTGWVTHSDIQAEARWFATGNEGTQIGCTQATRCTLTAADRQHGRRAETPTSRRLRSAAVSTSASVQACRQPRRRSTSSCSTPTRSTSSPTACSFTHPDAGRAVVTPGR